jgi:hypothetical protein
MQMGTVRPFALFLLAILAGASLTYSQIVSGTIVGNVRDESGGAVANTQVTLRNLDTNQVRQTVANDGGAFTFATLLPGAIAFPPRIPGRLV